MYKAGDKVEFVRNVSLPDRDSIVFGKGDVHLVDDYHAAIERVMIQGLWINCADVKPYVMVDAVPAPVKSLRYNTGKPQLSYILDFPNATDILMTVLRKDNDLYGATMLDMVEAFQDGGPVDLLAVVIVDLLHQLQEDLNFKHKPFKDTMLETFEQVLAQYYDAWSEFSLVCSNGSIKYDRNNWKVSGLLYMDLLDCFMRHYVKSKTGKKYDVEELIKDGVTYNFKTHHLAHAIWNLMAILEYSVIHPEVDDRAAIQA